MMTFSVNIGLDTEAISYPVQDYLDDILLKLEDNEDKLINPWDIRDAILSLWSSVPFKQTSVPGSISYVGLDAINPSERDIKRKIYLGKRAFSGTYSYTEFDNIMNDTLLGSDVDIFLYNTKIDTKSQTSTRVAIIAGTNLSLHTKAPYIQSQIVSGTTQSLSLDIINPSLVGGDINIQSLDSPSLISGHTASVIVNNIIFPTLDESGLSASNEKILFMQDGELIWDFIQLPNLGFIGNTGSQLDIYGTPTNVNGYSLEFEDTRMCPVQIGDINYGDTFNNMPLSEGLRRIIYDYLPPTCSIEITGVYSVGYAEVGTYPTPKLEYTINKKTLNTVTTGLSNMIPGAYPPIVSNSYETITGSSSGVVISPIPPVSTEFTITVGDGLNTASASTQITGIYPYFHGFSTNTTMNSIGLAGLSKLVESMGDKTIDVNGIGNLYFIFDSDYGTLSNIYDEYGNTSSGSFSYTTEILSSPTGLWAAKEFYVYQWNGAPQIGPPSVNYQFKY